MSNNLKGLKRNKMPRPSKKKPPPKANRTIVIWLIIGLTLLYLYSLQSVSLTSTFKKLSYGEFYQLVEAGKVKSCEKRETILRGKLVDGSGYLTNVPAEDQDLIRLLRSNVEDFKIEPPKIFLASLIYSLGPVILFIGFLWFFLYRGAQQGGGRILSFGKSRARQNIKGKEKITFNDVAGVDEAKEELKEIIEFLKDPKGSSAWEARFPRECS